MYLGCGGLNLAVRVLYLVLNQLGFYSLPFLETFFVLYTFDRSSKDFFSIYRVGHKNSYIGLITSRVKV